MEILWALKDWVFEEFLRGRDLEMNHTILDTPNIFIRVNVVLRQRYIWLPADFFCLTLLLFLYIFGGERESHLTVLRSGFCDFWFCAQGLHLENLKTIGILGIKPKFKASAYPL